MIDCPTCDGSGKVPFSASPCSGCRGIGRIKNPHAVELGKLGGKASAAKLTPEERSAKSRKAANIRWARYGYLKAKEALTVAAAGHKVPS